MPNIKPVSDLRNYGEVLDDVSEDSPVFLTRNGRGCYVSQDIHEYEKKEAALKLMSELDKGFRSGKENGWLSSDDVKASYRRK